MRCRICHGDDFVPMVDLGATPLADDFLTLERLGEPETYYPLAVVLCVRCHLAQLTYTVPRELLYGPEYPYVSSTTETGRAHYRAMAKAIADRFEFRSGLAVDIGSNVGVLLDGFARCGMDVLGIEPVPKIAEAANVAGIPTLATFFDAATAREIAVGRRRARVVTATNVVAHIDDLHDLADGVASLLTPDGVFVFEAPYLGDLMEQRAYDTIYHEHLSYLSLEPVVRLLFDHGLELFDVERQAIHGGTLRYFVAARGTREVSRRVEAMLIAEAEFYAAGTLREFAADVKLRRFQLTSMIYEAAQTQSVVAVSAPAKGMTLLNACGLDGQVLDFVTEKAPLKIGRFTPGTHLPVVPDRSLIEAQPDYALLLAWNFAAEIMANLKDYRGSFIAPIPKPRVVGASHAVPQFEYARLRSRT